MRNFLRFSKNKIQDQGAVAIAKMIENNPTLLVLFLHWNMIKGVGGIALAHGLHENSTIQIFDGSFNSLKQGNDNDVAKEFKKMFKDNFTLRHVDIT
jgi:hypothetical protein